MIVVVGVAGIFEIIVRRRGKRETRRTHSSPFICSLRWLCHAVPQWFLRNIQLGLDLGPGQLDWIALGKAERGSRFKSGSAKRHRRKKQKNHILSTEIRRFVVSPRTRVVSSRCEEYHG